MNIQITINNLGNKLSKTLNQITIHNAKRHFPKTLAVNEPFFIIGIPGSLCEVQLCLRYIPPGQPVYFIANGLSAWELNYANSNLKVDGLIKIGRTLPHGEALDLLFDMYSHAFGVMDCDCFVFDQTCFSLLKELNEHTLLSALFCHKNRILNLEIPETFIMFFNTPMINKIRKSFNVSSNLVLYDQLSDLVKQKLNTIGIDESHYTEDFKRYFDTAKLWLSLGLAEGYKINFVGRQSTLTRNFRKVFHVGSGNKTNRLNSLWNVRGTYFWRRALETCKDQELQSFYYQKFGGLKSNEIFTLVPDLCKQIGTDFFDVVEKVVKYE